MDRLSLLWAFANQTPITVSYIETRGISVSASAKIRRKTITGRVISLELDGIKDEGHHTFLIKIVPNPTKEDRNPTPISTYYQCDH